MIMSTKYKSLKSTSEMLGKSEADVFELLKHGFLEGRVIEGRMHTSQDSIEKYLNRFGEQLCCKNQVNVQRRDFSISEAINILGSESEVHKLIQSGELKTVFNNGNYNITGESMRRLIIGGRE